MKITATINKSLIAATLLLAATPFASQAALQVNYPDGSECQPLIAGQYIEAGEVCVEVQGTTLAVTYNMFGDWELLEAHLWSGVELVDMPANKKGNPKIGNFPFVTGDITGATTFTFNVSLEETFGEAEPCDLTGLLAGHAAVRRDNGDGGFQTETGWIDGQQIIDKGSWAMFSSVDFTCPIDTAPPPVEKTCSTETAYALGDQTFIDLGITNSRWGWQVTVNDGDDFTTPIYAGAGQNDITKGTEVGELAVSYLNGELTVTYLMLNGFVMEDLHLNVSEDDLVSIAPGHYTVVEEGLANGEETEFTYTSYETAASINVVAHAVVEVCTE
ncbi:hypothetical protein KKHLCK_13520 [Candidatus Electrothrix laxa]